VERRLFRPAGKTVAMLCHNILELERGEPLPGCVEQWSMPLDRVYAPAKRTEHRGLVPGAGSDLEHTHVFANLELLRHVSDDEGLADRLAAGDWQRAVVIGAVDEGRIHEHFAR